jgi:hypothetical protein
MATDGDFFVYLDQYGGVKCGVRPFLTSLAAQADSIKKNQGNLSVRAVRMDLAGGLRGSALSNLAGRAADVTKLQKLSVSKRVRG